MRQALSNTEEEKPPALQTVKTETTEPEATESHDIKPNQFAPEFHTETTVEKPLAIQNEPEISQAVVSEQLNDELVAAHESELPDTKTLEALFAKEAFAEDEVPKPEAVYEVTPDVPETDSIAMEVDIEQTDEATLPADFPIEFMMGDTSAHIPERIIHRIDETITAHFEQLEPEARESSLIILQDIATAVREISETPHELEPEKLVEIEQHLTKLCTELFAHIELELDEETIRWFVHKLMVGSAQIDQEPKNLEDFMEEGTHEQRQADFHILSRLLTLIKSSLSRLQRLGRLAVGPKLLRA